MTDSSDSLTVPKSLLRKIAFAAGAVVALILVILVAVAVARSLSASDSLASGINSGEYQAVFLTNNQVYFGKLTAPGGDYYYLRHVYYLQSQVSPQSGKRPRQTLIKLGNEIHGPEDLMIISRKQILFVENLKPSGQVSRAIQHAGGQ
ncbi:MAG TPA: hypothetical protein VF898_11340 [Chloroflexota bacterium]